MGKSVVLKASARDWGLLLSVTSARDGVAECPPGGSGCHRDRCPSLPGPPAITYKRPFVRPARERRNGTSGAH